MFLFCCCFGGGDGGRGCEREGGTEAGRTGGRKGGREVKGAVLRRDEVTCSIDALCVSERERCDVCVDVKLTE
eukprot:437059-Rhodomonas_salina.1